MTPARGREHAPGNGVGALAADVLCALTSAGDDADTEAALVRVLERGRALLGARWAGLVLRRQDGPQVVAATSEDGRDVVTVQVELRVGPVLDALALARTVVTGDVGSDPRWPSLGQRLPLGPEVHSLAVVPLPREPGAPSAVLVLGSDRRAAFPAARLARGRVLASSLGLLLDAHEALDEAAGLRLSLERDRQVGMAIGIVMATHRLTRDQALDVLRAAGRDTDRRLADVVTEVVDAGRAPRASTGRR